MFAEIERPARNKRTIGEQWDVELEVALRKTAETGKAIVVDLARFHSSPAKSRLWGQGYAVRHRVLSNRVTVGAWVESKQ